jgi:uncharacterized protein (UPF0333 family)
MLLQTRTHDDVTVAEKKSRRGATLMEYLMMISLIVVVCLIAIGYVGTANSGNMNSSAKSISKAVKGG